MATYVRKVLRRLLARIGYEPRREREPESVRLVKRLAEQLNEKATRFRTVAGRAAMLEQRVGFLETDLKTWERRARAVRERRQLELLLDAERICGRIEGQLQEARAELAVLAADETHLRGLLTDERRRFADLLRETRELGHDVSECLLYVDLIRPEPLADLALCADDDREFVARVIDSSGLH